VNTAAEYLAARSRLEIQRLTGKRGLPAKQRRWPMLRASRRWQKWEFELLGTALDSVIAKKLNRTKESIKCQRKKSGVPPFRRMHFWTKAEDKIILNYTCKEAARRLKRDFSSVESRRRLLRVGNVGIPARKWTPREIDMLGKHTDTDLAR